MGRHTRSHEVRCEVLRGRIEDWLRSRDSRQTYETRLDTQRDFARRAVRVGRDRKMRIWSENTISAEEGALSSLKFLLKEKSVKTNGKTNTGSNESWVLELWEAVLEESTKSLLPKLEDATSTATEPDDIEEEGVIVFARQKVSTPTPSSRLGEGFSNRLLEAWISRDEGSFIELAREIEKMERGEAAA